MLKKCLWLNNYNFSTTMAYCISNKMGKNKIYHIVGTFPNLNRHNTRPLFFLVWNRSLTKKMSGLNYQVTLILGWSHRCKILRLSSEISRSQMTMDLVLFIGLDSMHIWVTSVAHIFKLMCWVLVLCLSLACLLYAQCCQCFWIGHSWFHLRISLMFIFGSKPRGF